MSLSAVIFYILSACILGAGLLAVTARKIFRSAIWLLFSLVSVAGLYFWLQMEFLAAVQIVVYVGGIVVLIIFSVFLTQRSGKKMLKPPVGRIIFSALAAFLGFALTYSLIQAYSFNAASAGMMKSGVKDIGLQLLSPNEHGYVFPFEAVSILLLAAMIGCIVIAMKVKPEAK